MSGRIYLVTEGVHDVFFLGKLLKKALGFEKVEDIRKLEEEWKHIVPNKFPIENSLRPAVPVPTFYKNADASVAIVNADGIERIKTRLGVHLDQLTAKGVTIDAVGVVLDADFTLAGQKAPVQRFAEMANALASLGLPRPAVVDAVSGAPRTGVFVLPGGGALGTLEDVLLECAAIVYPTLGCRAVRFVDGLDRSAPDFNASELKEINAPSGRNKAVLATMSAVLKPGKPIQTSIEDHRWIEPRTLVLPRVAAVVGFLQQLVGAPAPVGMP